MNLREFFLKHFFFGIKKGYFGKGEFSRGEPSSSKLEQPFQSTRNNTQNECSLNFTDLVPLSSEKYYLFLEKLLLILKIIVFFCYKDSKIASNGSTKNKRIEKRKMISMIFFLANFANKKWK